MTRKGEREIELDEEGGNKVEFGGRKRGTQSLTREEEKEIEFEGKDTVR